MNNSVPTNLTTEKNMDNFLETYGPPKLNQEETDQLNMPIIRNEIEQVIKTLPTNKTPREANSSKQTQKELIPMLNILQMLEGEGTFPKIFYEATITLVLNQTKKLPKKKIIDQYL